MNTKLLELFQIGGRKNYEFHYKIIDDKVNLLSVDKDNKIISVSIGDPENEDLSNIVSDVMKELE